MAAVDLLLGRKYPKLLHIPHYVFFFGMRGNIKLYFMRKLFKFRKIGTLSEIYIFAHFYAFLGMGRGG